MAEEAYVLPEKATIEAAQAVLAEAASEREGSMTLDASHVESIDGCVVLTLAAIAFAAAENDRRVALKEPSAAFVDAFSDLGLFQDLMKMEFVK
ncbi:MAG: STAS domain-containing protein [Pseudomonadota bacterium]